MTPTEAANEDDQNAISLATYWISAFKASAAPKMAIGCHWARTTVQTVGRASEASGIQKKHITMVDVETLNKKYKVQQVVF